MNAFGCFDDCLNYVAGFFIGKGNILYKDIFFNHQVLMPYLSQIVQHISSPQTIYELLLRHRQFHFVFAFGMTIFLLLRFGPSFILFSLLYEPTKFYLFGDRFLAEGLIVYVFVYLFALIWHRLHNRTVLFVDTIAATVGTWFIIYSREPYIPAALFLFGIFLSLQYRIKKKYAWCGMFLFLFLSAIVCISIPLHEFWFQVVTVNKQTTFSLELNQAPIGIQFIRSFFYPFILIFSPLPWNNFHVFVVMVIVFGMITTYISRHTLSRWAVIISFILLSLVNLRYVQPNSLYYSAYRLLSWYGLLIAFVVLVVSQASYRFRLFSISILLVSCITISILPGSFITEKDNSHEEFLINYGNLYAAANAIRLLSTSHQTLFLDGADDLIYWQSDRVSPYPYSWYTSVMPEFPIYRDKRETMFHTNPPDFYYRFCSNIPLPDRSLPDFLQNTYTQIYENGTPSCLYIKNDILPLIRPDQWEKAGAYLYSPKKN